MFKYCVYLLIAGLVACNQPDPNTLKIGTIAGPETKLVEVARRVAQQNYGLKIKIVEFNDYRLPNEALQDGSIDANIYQHQPYLQNTMEHQHYDLVVIGKTFIYPTGIYSKKYTALADLPKHALIALPNDPSNAARALKLLQKAQLIRLNHNPLPSLKDMTQNAKQLRFKELDAAQLARVLPDVDAAVINTTFALPAKLLPTVDALFIESQDSPYANLIVTKKAHPKMHLLKQFVQTMNSNEVKNEANILFKGAAVPAW